MLRRSILAVTRHCNNAIGPGYPVHPYSIDPPSGA